MGVKGLWRLIANCGTPVPLESLEHKILAIDVSIWLHQAVRGFQGFGSGSVANAHLLTLFHRICKLLFYRIRPVFVFDGGVPQLKRQTLSSRRLRREAAAGKAQKVRDRLLSNLLRSHAVRNALGKRGPGPSLHRVSKPVKREKDLFELPPLAKPFDDRIPKTSIGSDSEEEEDYICQDMSQKNLHNFEYDAHEFKSLPLETQHEILSELQSTRKENSWHDLNEMPQESNSFSSFQMNRLMKRNSFQKKLDDIRSEIKKINTAEIEATLFGDLEKHVSLTHKIISEDATHSILVKNIKEIPIQDNQTEVLPKKRKSKNTDVKQDFLTELAKQGIVSYDFNENGKRDFDSSFSLSSDDEEYVDSLSEDEGSFSTKKKKKLEEVAFLKAVDLVLDDSEITQEEIYSLIKQTQFEVESESAKSDNKNSIPEIKYADMQKPSTSSNAPGIIYNCDAESTDDDDDDDFIDVSEPELESADVTNCKNIKHDTKLSPQKTATQASNMNDSNVEKILGAKTESLYIKILQQKLGDMVQTPSNTKNLVDTRKLGNENSSEQSISSPTKGNVMISINLKNTNVSFENDIFSDIFNNKIEKGIASDNPQENRVISDISCGKFNSKVKPSNFSCSKISENLVNYNASNDSTNLSLSKTAHVTEQKTTSENVEHGIDLKHIKITDELKQKVSELVREEITNFIRNSSLQNTSQKESENNSVLNKDIVVSSQSPEKVVNQINEEVANINKINFDLEINTRRLQSSDIVHNEVNYDPDKLHVTASRFNTDCNMRNNDFNELSESLNNSNEEHSTSSTGKEMEKFRLELNGSNTDTKTIELPKEPCLNPIKYSVDDLKYMENELKTEEASLLAEINQVEKVAVDISDQMYGEAQELLKIFGLPFLVAPMEAEAQCAFLDLAKLTHGTITNDSDIFLFGGKRVYKNFFNQDKHVECFTVDNIQYNIGLDRNKMITLAMLTGSDYTIGIESVGAVLGMEILSEFPGSDRECLKNLKKWWNVASKNVCNIQVSKTKQRLSRLYFPESFPNENIYTAYLHPEVDESKEKFSWGIPSVEDLRTFTAEKFGWNRAKTDEIIFPVFKKLGVKETQMRIESYFNNIKLVKEPHNKSKRLQDAISRTKEDNTDASKNTNGISNSERKNIKRTLLMDPSQGNYGPTIKKKRGQKKEKISTEDKSTEGTSQGTKVNKKSKKLQKPTEKILEEPTEAPMTKEEKKKQIYMKLQEKETITQLEAEKIEKNRKKALAVEILSKSRTKK